MPRFVAGYTMKREDVVAADVMVGKTRRVTKSGIAESQNQMAGFVIVEATDIDAAAGLFQDHPHINVFPGDGIDVMPDATGAAIGAAVMKQATAMAASNWRRLYATRLPQSASILESASILGD